MKKYFNIVLVTFICFLIPIHAWGNGIGEKVKKKYSGMKSISVVFTIDNSQVKTTLKAKKGNMFVLDNNGNVVYCNGKTVWNYNKPANKCMISARDIHAESTSIDEVFLNVLNTYIVDKANTINDSKSGSGYVITLKPATANSMINGIKSINVVVDKKTLSIKQLMFSDSSGGHTINIVSFKMNPTLADGMFSFTPPKSTTVIDMR